MGTLKTQYDSWVIGCQRYIEIFVVILNNHIINNRYGHHMDWVRNIERQVGGYGSILETSWREEVMKEEALMQRWYVLQTGTTHW